MKDNESEVGETARSTDGRVEEIGKKQFMVSKY